MEKESNTKISVKVKISLKELYEFIMYSNYKCLRGVFSILFSVMSAVGTVYYWNEFSNIQRVLMIFMALLFTVIAPVEYYWKAKRQIKKNFNDALLYVFDGEGITISKNEETSSLRWDEVMKVITTKNLIVVYFTPVRAFIIPKNTVNSESEFNELKDLMQQNTSCYKFCMKW